MPKEWSIEFPFQSIDHLPPIDINEEISAASCNDDAERLELLSITISCCIDLKNLPSSEESLWGHISWVLSSSEQYSLISLQPAASTAAHAEMDSEISAARSTSTC
ncbi:hypothetical protein V6N13_145036 [Hibiscus sabdariffa]